MTERYTRVFYTNRQMYAEESPVIICAGALLKDNVVDRMVAQIKFRNIRSKVIKAVVAKFDFFDIWNQPIIQNHEFSYLDLTLGKGQDTGAKIPVVVNDCTVRSFSVEIIKVAFSDGTTWELNDKFEAVPNPIKLTTKITDQNLLKFYKDLHGRNQTMVPFEYKDIWVCGCGEYNEKGHKCCGCKAEFENLNFWIDEEKLSKENSYIQATRLMDLNRIFDYEQAIKLFRTISDWKDSFEMISKCENGISILREKEERERQEREKRKKKIRRVTMTMFGFLVVVFGILVVNRQKLTELYDRERIKYAQIGESIIFGEYEQDNDLNNGKEDIEWIVLDVVDEKILLISKNVLDSQPFNENYEASRWEGCTLRLWLNSSFMNEAFSEEEQNRILTTTVVADNNLLYKTLGGKNTEDKIFVLSYKEAKNYFSTNESLMVTGPSEYAVDQGLYLSDQQNCCWWLRTPGKSGLNSVIVDFDGTLSLIGREITYDRVGVRPVIWISK